MKKKGKKRKMRDQVLTPLPKPLTGLFSKLLATNLVAKMRQRAVPEYFKIL